MEERETGLTVCETTDGRTLSYRESSGVRLYRGLGNLRRLSQTFLPDSFKSPFSSGYGDSVLELKLAGLAFVGKGMNRYLGLDTNGLNTYMRAMSGISPVINGEELPDTLRVELINGTFVYFPTEALLEKFGVQRRN